MIVNINNKTYFVGWVYDNKKKPTKTKCQLKDYNKNIIAEVEIVRYHKDPVLGGENQKNKEGKTLTVTEANDKLRKYSLEKLLNQAFPGQFNRGVRQGFWNAYFTRNDPRSYAIVNSDASEIALPKS